MGVDVLLSRLEKVRRAGAGKWQARCPAHDDRGPSLSVRELEDGRTLVHCFAQCAVEDVLTAVGLTFDTLFPERPPPAEGFRRQRQPFFKPDVFAAARHEIAVVHLIACDMHKGKAITEADYERLFSSVDRLNEIGSAAYGS